MLNRHQTPFEAYVAPARANAALWQTALGLCLIAIVYITFLVMLSQLFPRVFNPNQTTSVFKTLYLLGSFAGMGFGAMLIARHLHKRSVLTLLGPIPRVVRDFVTVCVAVVPIYTLTLVFWSLEYDAIQKIDLSMWLMILPMSLLGVFIQTGAEEIVFRGYLQQQLAARFVSPIVWMILPSVLFGFLHYDPEATGQNLWLIVIATGLFGLIAADLTARTGSLGAAWGLHFANNVGALLFLATQGSLTGLSLYITPYAIDDPQIRNLITLDIAAMLVTWLLARVLLRR